MDFRKEIFDIIKSDFYIPMTTNELFELVCKDKEHMVKDFFKTLCEMEECFEIFVSKKGKVSLPPEGMYVRGIFHAPSHGKFGFVVNDEGESFIPPALVCGAMDGDTVVAKRIDKGSHFYGKGNEAEIVAIVERAIVEFTGTFEGFSSKGKLYGSVYPDNPRLDFVATVLGSAISAETGDKVACKITKYPLFEGDKIGVKVTEAFGKSESKEANYKAILREHKIPERFENTVLDEAERVSNEPICVGNRLDLRDKTIFTIDSESAKDLDDAISIERTDDGYILGVHIADVSHYVREKSEIDKEAMARGTSVYFTDKVVPMLPPSLSNGACSLNGGVDRYALSAIIRLDKAGNIKDTTLAKSIINSKMRGVYSELNDIIENGENSEFYTKYRHIVADFNIMRELYLILKRRSDEAGAMELEGDEVEILLDSEGYPCELTLRERGESERLIEQFMLCANRAVAEFLAKHSLPCIYRVHESPDPEKIRSFAIFAGNLGIDVSPIADAESITPLSLSLVLEDARKKGKAEVASGVLLRSLMKAKYMHEPKGHFGLATKLYCHFTSPIRRYPDLGVHRIISSYLNNEMNKSELSRLTKYAERSAKESSDNELRALFAEREIEELYKTVYMSDFVGEVLEGTISSVTSFGFFVKCDNLCEGLVPIVTLGPLYFDEGSITLSSPRRIFALGMRVKVKVLEANVITRRVTLELVECEEADRGERLPPVVFNTPKITDKRTSGRGRGGSRSRGKARDGRHGKGHSRRKGKRR